MPYAFAQLHKHTDKHSHTNTNTQACACACNKQSHIVLVTACLLPHNQHIGFNTEVKKLFVCRDFFCLLPLSFVLPVKNAYKQDREIKGKNILYLFLIQWVGGAKNCLIEI